MMIMTARFPCCLFPAVCALVGAFFTSPEQDALLIEPWARYDKSTMRQPLFSPRFVLALLAGTPLCIVALLITAPRTTARDAPPPLPAGSQSAGSVNVSQTSWIGNSFSGKDSAYMVNFCDALYAAPNGTVYTNTYFEEGGREIAAYQWDAARAAWNSKGTAKWVHGTGGRAIGGYGDYLFAGQMLTDSKTGALRFGLSRRNLRAEDLTPVAWKTGGTDANATGWTPFVPAFLALSPPLTPVPNEPGHDAIGLWRQRSVRGIVATKTRLFVSVPGESESQNTVQVFDISRPDTVAKVTSWRVPNAAQIAYDTVRGEVWVLQNTRPENGDGAKGLYAIRCFDAKGTAKPARTITLPPGTNPTALAWDAKTSRVLVSDWGAGQQVHAFFTASATPTGAPPIGTKGGLWAGTTTQGRFADAADKTGRLFGPRCLSVDAEGNVYVIGTGSNGLVRLDTVTPQNQPSRPPLFAAEAVGIVDADPADLSDVYSDSKHYRVNYNKNIPGREGRLVGLTANPIVFPQDPRFSVPFGPSGVHAYRLKNRLFLFIKFSRGLGIYRFDRAHFGETAIPCAFIAEENVSNQDWPFWTPSVNTWIWRDLNGDGKFDKNEFAVPTGYGPQAEPISTVHTWVVDENGTLTTVKGLGRELISYPLRGLDKWGSPIYDTSGTDLKTGTNAPQMESALPAPFTNNQARFAALGPFGFPGGRVTRLSYDAAADTMFLCGYSITYPDTLEARIKAGRMDYSNPPVSGPPGKETGWKQDEEGDGNPAGRLLAAYPRWSQGGRTPLWIRTLPYRSAAAEDYFKADVPNGIAVAGRFVFVGYRYGQRIILYDAKTGVLQPEYLLPDTNIVGDNHGALDIAQPISALFLLPDKAAGRPNGEYIVWTESNTRARILMHRWKPKTP